MEDNRMNIGKVAMTTAGDYNSSQEYKKLTCVHYNFCSWVSRKDVPAGVAPTPANSDFWQKISDRGERGPQGQSYVDREMVPIVDNLTTGGSSNVLSAEQGKILKEELTELESQVYDDIKNFVNGEYDNLFDKCGKQIEGKYVGSSGVLSGESNSITSYLIPVIAGNVYAYCVFDGNTYPNNYLCFVDINGNALKPLNAEDNTEIDYSFAIPSSTQLYKAPSNAVYAQFTIKFALNDSISDIVVFTQADTIPSVYSPYIPRISREQLTVRLKKEIDSIPEKAGLHESVGINLYNKAEGVIGRYISTDTGTLQSASNCEVSGLILIEPNKTYYLHRDGVTTFEVRFLAEDGTTPIKAINPDTNEPFHNFSLGQVSGAVKAPSNAKYFQFTVVFLSNGDKDVTQFQYGNSYTGYVPYQVRDIVPYSELPQELEYVRDSIGSINSKQSNPLFLKKIYFEGDSIMEASADTVNPGGWAEIIGEKNNADYANQAKSGATFVNHGGGRACISTRIKAIPSTADMVIIQGGCNDSSLSTLGAITPDYSTAFDTSTFYGAIEEIVKYSLLTFKKVGFIVNYRFGYDAESEQTNKQNFLNAIVDVCTKWGMPYIDLRKCAGFNLIDDDLRMIYGCALASIAWYDENASYSIDDRVKVANGEGYLVYKCNENISAPAGTFDATKWTVISGGDVYDSWHCNHKAYEVSAPKIEAWMKTL